MSVALHKKSILKKTFEIGSSTLLSRFFGVIREFLWVRYLGAGAISDAFFTAFKIPNSLRKIFAEGALSAALIPTFVSVVRKDKEQASSLISLSFLIFEGFLVLICALMMFYAEAVLHVIVPGFSPEHIAYTIPFLQILMPFILFVSSSAILAGALQSVGHFFVPAFAPVLLNIIYIGATAVCLFFSWPVEYFCFFIVLGGVVQLAIHVYMYLKLHFTFAKINKQTWLDFKDVLIKFFPCLLSMSVMEVGLFIDTSFASYLPAGSMSLINYAYRFMGIPLGVFAVSFSTILLPHFSRVGAYAPKRMGYYLLETTKFVYWVTIPAMILMMFFAEKFFHTLFLSDKFTLLQVHEARNILIAFLVALFFFSLNKILLNIYYSLHVTSIPTVISIFATVLNIILDYVLLTKYQAVGLAAATTLSIGVIQTMLLALGLFWKFKFKIYFKNFFDFFIRYTIKLILVLSVAYFLYGLIERYIELLPQGLAQFLLYGLGFWFWVGPLCGMVMIALFYLRKAFKIELHFLD
jgi:putative peptidoglycan lipid II flippase